MSSRQSDKKAAPKRSSARSPKPASDTNRKSTSRTKTNRTKRGGARASATSGRKRAPQHDGPRTTLRLPGGLALLADALGSREGISRNDAVVRLAVIGAEQQQRLDAISERGEKRLAAWRTRERPRTGKFPTADEFQAAVGLARSDEVDGAK